MKFTGFEKLVTSATILTEANTARLGYANVAIFTDKADGTSKMKVEQVNGETQILSDISSMQVFVDEAVKEITLLDLIDSRTKPVRRAVYGQKTSI